MPYPPYPCENFTLYSIHYTMDLGSIKLYDRAQKKHTSQKTTLEGVSGSMCWKDMAEKTPIMLYTEISQMFHEKQQQIIFHLKLLSLQCVGPRFVTLT